MNKTIFPGLLSALVVFVSSRSATINQLPQRGSNQSRTQEHRILGGQVNPQALNRFVAKSEPPNLGLLPSHLLRTNTFTENVKSPLWKTLPLGRISESMPEVSTPANEFTSNVFHAKGNGGEETGTVIPPVTSAGELMPTPFDGGGDESQETQDIAESTSNQELTPNLKGQEANANQSQETGDVPEPSSAPKEPSKRTGSPQTINLKMLQGMIAEITIVAPEGSTYRVERSLDLASWGFLADGTGNSTVVDQDAANHLSAFYRVVPK